MYAQKDGIELLLFGKRSECRLDNMFQYTVFCSLFFIKVSSSKALIVKTSIHLPREWYLLMFLHSGLVNTGIEICILDAVKLKEYHY